MKNKEKIIKGVPTISGCGSTSISRAGLPMVNLWSCDKKIKKRNETKYNT